MLGLVVLSLFGLISAGMGQVILDQFGLVQIQLILVMLWYVRLGYLCLVRLVQCALFSVWLGQVRPVWVRLCQIALVCVYQRMSVSPQEQVDPLPERTPQSFSSTGEFADRARQEIRPAKLAAVVLFRGRVACRPGEAARPGRATGVRGSRKLQFCYNIRFYIYVYVYTFCVLYTYM